MELRVYQSAREIAEVYFSAAGLPPDEVEVVGMLSGSYEEVEFTLDEFVVALEGNPMWGFVDTLASPPVIHAWASPGASLEELVALMAHEIGHVTGEALEDDEAEERRADEFAAVAVQALGLAQQLQAAVRGGMH